MFSFLNIDHWLKSGSINKTPATEPSDSIKEDGINNNRSTSQGMSSTLLPSTTGDSVPKTSNKRKYDESYLEMGFIETNDFVSLKNTSFADLSKKAITILLPFATTYLCKTGFSAYTATKTKYRNRLNVKLDFRIQLSQIEPDIAKLSKNKQRTR